MCFRIENTGCLNLWCHINVKVFARKFIRDDEKIDVSYTSSLVFPHNNVALCKVSSKKK